MPINCDPVVVFAGILAMLKGTVAVDDSGNVLDGMLWDEKTYSQLIGAWDDEASVFFHGRDQVFIEEWLERRTGREE